MKPITLAALLITLILGGLAMAATAAANDWLDHDMRRLHSSETVNVKALAADAPAVLLVNTASHCGFTGQFEGLETLHQTYADRGLKVIGFSSDSFNQEADDEAAAAETCFVNFGVSFDMMATVPVRGGKAHPIFAELARQSRAPRWNFNKYLVSPEGEVVEAFGAMTRPGSAKLKRAIEQLLNQAAFPESASFRSHRALRSSLPAMQSSAETTVRAMRDEDDNRF